MFLFQLRRTCRNNLSHFFPCNVAEECCHSSLSSSTEARFYLLLLSFHTRSSSYLKSRGKHICILPECRVVHMSYTRLHRNILVLARDEQMHVSERKRIQPRSLVLLERRNLKVSYCELDSSRLCCDLTRSLIYHKIKTMHVYNTRLKITKL